MHIFVSHETVYRYDRPVSGIIQILRLTPRDHDGQHVNRWRIDVSKTCRLVRHEDAFGNVTHVLAVDGPLAELRVAVDGEVDTKDTSGIVRDAVERFPPSLFLRATPLTAPDPAIVDFAKETREAAGDEMLNVLHHLLLRLHRELAYDLNSTRAATTAAEAFALKRGVCQDLAHIFIAAARCLGIPARYVGGHLHRVDGVTEQEAGHAWAEAFVPDLGWVAFDPANGICATEAHVRVAIGLDYLGAAPVRGSRYGGGSETLEVAVRVDQAAQQVQS
ncbi:MAG TPA: transglutaminase family protein [Xanthobacteraceae bacterium]|jgi:transglutaminase-like putative cysteine protease|nr:transglutaminase family protein [Xanthobacteraceae bacterium]